MEATTPGFNTCAGAAASISAGSVAEMWAFVKKASAKKGANFNKALNSMTTVNRFKTQAKPKARGETAAKPTGALQRPR